MERVATSDSDSEFEPGGGRCKKTRRRGNIPDFVRMTSRKRGMVSYKESSHSNDDSVGEEGGEGGEVGGGEGDSRDVIERVLKNSPRRRE